jgi:hypothetical protein
MVLNKNERTQIKNWCKLSRSLKGKRCKKMGVQQGRGVHKFVNGIGHVWLQFLIANTFTSSSGERGVSFTYLSRITLGTEKYFVALK